MSNFFSIVIEHHRRNSKRAREFKYFKACMAAAAVIAIADLRACRKESAAVKALVKTMEELKLYDTAHGLEIYEGYLGGMEKNAERGQAAALADISVVKDDPEWAALLVAICATMSEADGVVVDSEIETIQRICDMLDIEYDVARAIRLDARDEMHE